MTPPALDDAVARATAALPGVSDRSGRASRPRRPRGRGGRGRRGSSWRWRLCARGAAAALAIFERDYLRDLPVSFRPHAPPRRRR
ncbi:MAG: hypothetical protein IPH80_32050 [Myxococcales bacterium]|nr:hypothetical protein [Myxococcales bacterium]